MIEQKNYSYIISDKGDIATENHPKLSPKVFRISIYAFELK